MASSEDSSGPRPVRRGTRLRRAFWMLVRTYLLLCVAVFLVQCRLIYHPDETPPGTPDAVRWPGLREVDLVASDGVALKAWHWPGAEPVTLVIFHGNAGNRGGGRLPWIAGFQERGLGVMIIDYRGYGGSAGSPSEAGLYLDAEAAVAWIERETEDALVFLGESLGGGVAVEMATRHAPAGLVVQSGFSSLVDAAGHHFPWLPVRLLLRDRYDNVSKIGRVACPYLHLHGEVDTVVPVELGRRLFEAASEPKEWAAFPTRGHNDLGGAEYYERVVGFARSVASRRSDPPTDGERPRS